MSFVNRSRKRQVIIRLSDEEYDLFSLKAEEAEITKSQYVRNMILYGFAHKRTVFSADAERKLRFELNRIGNNINQIALRVNTNKQLFSEDLRILQDEYNDLLDLYQKIFKEEYYGNNEDNKGNNNS